MGVFVEERPLRPSGMHWQQQQQQQQQQQHQHQHDRYTVPSVGREPSPARGDAVAPGATTCDATGGDTTSGCSTPTSLHNNNNNERRWRDQHDPLGGCPSPTGGIIGDHETADCAGCGARILDRFYLQAVDRRWHATCLQCCQCRLPLDTELTCFSRDGNIYCKQDYYRLFGVRRCARCQAAISASELVMRARDLVFHVHCFTCAACNAPLTKGDHFGMRDTAVLCRTHYELGRTTAVTAPYAAGGATPPYAAVGPHFGRDIGASMLVGAPPECAMQSAKGALALTTSPTTAAFFNGVATSTGAPPRQKGRPRKRKPKDLESMTASLDLNSDYLDMGFGRSPGTPGMPGSNQRTKRMRTSFKHHQLRTMKSYFAINHNPDAKDLKQLSQKTGLPKRVLQVWFQNARAKWRRMMLKQEGKSGSDKGDVTTAALDLELYGGPPGSLPRSPSSLDCS